MSTSFNMRLGYFCALIFLGWALSLFYGFLGQLFRPGWLSIAVFHSVLALLLWLRVKSLLPLTRSGPMAFLPAMLIVMGSVLAGLVSRGLVAGAQPIGSSWDGRLLAFVLWIPVVEEIVFRFAIGGIARQRLGDFWGAYGSALVFAMAHGSGAWNQLVIPLGPLLLALCCEWLYVTTGRLTAAIALHAACNASGWIFAALDDRWLNWLEALYLRV